MQNRQRQHRPSKSIAPGRIRPQEAKSGHVAAPSKEEVSHRQKAVREPLAERLHRKRSLVANDNLGRSRRGKQSPTGSARPFGQKVVLFLIWFTIVLLVTLISTTLVLETQLSFLANLGFAIGLACVASCVPVVDTIAKILALSLSAALIGLFSLFSVGP